MTRVLVDAFHDDPMWGAWAFPARRTRRAGRTAVFRMFVDGALRYATTWVAPGNTAVAMWIPPGGPGLSETQDAELESHMRALIGVAGAARIRRAFDLFAEMTPTEPHFYLSMLGTDPAYSGRGYGQELLARTLTAVDAGGAPAYLDCADELVPLYQRFGFRVIGSIVLPGGPRSNGMWRRPGG